MPNKHVDQSPPPISCPNTTNLFFVNSQTGEVAPVPCGGYTCEYCGPRKIWKLKSRLVEALSGKSLRLFTFTFTNRFYPDPILHHEILQAAWRYFLRDLRRHSGLSDKQKKVEFFRVIEQHKSGFCHYHVLFTQFLPVQILQPLWESSLVRAMAFQPFSHFANVDVSSFRPGRASRGVAKADHYNKKAVNYLLKYLTKSFSTGSAISSSPVTEIVGDDVLQRESDDSYALRGFCKRVRRYSKSNTIVLFAENPDREKTHIVASYNKGRFKQLHTGLYLDDLSITAQPVPLLIGSSVHFSAGFHQIFQL